MSNDFNFSDSNPYQTPQTPDWQTPGSRPPFNSTKVVAPAIGLIVVGVLGLIASGFNIVNAVVSKPEIDPTAPPFVQEMQKSAVGPVAATIQGVFLIVNVVIIVGGVMMARLSSWGMGLTATILSMLNFGSCCCALGIPIGIWSLVILLMNDVKEAFAQSQATTFRP